MENLSNNRQQSVRNSSEFLTQNGCKRHRYAPLQPEKVRGLRPAYGYLRVSSTGQAGDDKDGYSRQRRAIEAWASITGHTIVSWYAEDVSGTLDEGHRPAFSAMMVASQTEGVFTVAVERLDRLARRLMIQETLTSYLVGRGIQLHAADTGENITEAVQADPMKKAMIQMQGVFAELDKSSLVKKLRAARERRRAQEGRCEGRKPYGAKDGELGIIQKIKALRRKPRHAKRRSLHATAKALNAEGIPTRSGGAWTAQQVKNVEIGPYWALGRVHNV